MILSDGVIGQMMEKSSFLPSSAAVPKKRSSSSAPGRPPAAPEAESRTSLLHSNFDPRRWRSSISASRPNTTKSRRRKYASKNICWTMRNMRLSPSAQQPVSRRRVSRSRAQGIRVGLLRPTLWPFPAWKSETREAVKGILSLEFNAGQMVEDIRLAAEGSVPVQHFGRLGGIIPDPDEVVEALKRLI